ncbi:MAG: excinuclease ABC subunit UvrC [Patescibacteria group bacterium]
MLKNAQKLPQKPGVYLYKNKDKQVIYVGKAKNLRNRVKSYFLKSADLAADKKLMVEEIKKIDYVVVDNELEAIYLESNLIKKYHPKYNIILRDDKFFVYIKIPKEEYPRVLLTRRLTKDKAQYFGPYLSAKQAKRVIFSLRKIFPHRICNVLPKSVCLEHHLGHCNAPCIKAVTKVEYNAVVDNIINFLRGRYSPVLKRLNNQMKTYSQAQQYEKAAKLRDQVVALEIIIEKQKIISPQQENQDVISLTKEKDWGVINLLQVRSGKLIDSQNFMLDHLGQSANSEILTSFAKQYYANTVDHPQEIVVAQPVDQVEVNKLTKAKVMVTQKGRKKQLINLSQQNSKEWLLKKDTFVRKREQAARSALKELSVKLKIKIPGRIEAYDIANIQGQNATGSMVVFCDGQADKSQYRKFAIKTFDTANDPGMIKEVLTRRFAKKHGWPNPQLILIDGGKPQLNAALAALKEAQKKIPIIALAKRLEEVYLPLTPKPYILPPNSPALYLIQRIRDEAHRFATGFYQQKHLKRIIRSKMEDIEGLGPKRRKLLKSQFGSLKNIKQSDLPELTKLVGQKTARNIIKYLGN